jgi:hypothetical protein
MQKYFYILMKGVASSVTLSAIFVELWGCFPDISKQLSFSLPSFLPIGAHIVLSVHGIEGAVAAAVAPRFHKQPLAMGLYTFFVGTLGLIELLLRDASSMKQKIRSYITAR